MGQAHVRRPQGGRLGPFSNGMLMSPEEFDRREDFDRRYAFELIHGVLIVSPPPGEAERDPNGELDYLLRSYQATHPEGRVLDKTLPEQHVHLPDSRRRADRVLWIGLGRIPDPKTDVPAIVVEFVSRRQRDRTRDYEEKRREYLEIGVREYGVIDRFRRLMTVVSGGPADVREQIIREHEVYRSPLLPGFELPLDRLLKVADDWSRRRPHGPDRGGAKDRPPG